MTSDPQTEAPAAPLTPLLRDAMVDLDDLHQRYGPLLRLVDTVLGVVPNCDRYLEIWPPAFRTYNVMVPNLLNLPVPVLGVGGPPPSAVGLAMYVASRTAACPYCTAHACSFAMRRGASPETVASALLPDATGLSRGELATVAVAKALARVPCELTAEHRRELVDVYGEHRAEWIVLGAVMMGFLNKFMDAIGVELEQPVVSETVATLGDGWAPGKAGAELDPAHPRRPAPPADGLRTKLRLLPLLPAVIRLDRRWQRGTPASRQDVAGWLRQNTGHDFPALRALHSNRARRTIATMLRDNLDPSTSHVGIPAKVLAGAVYASAVQDAELLHDVRALAAHAGLTDHDVDGAVRFARDADALPTAGALMLLARAASSSPATIDAVTVAACRDARLTPAAVVELICWLSVLQVLHRLRCWTAVSR